MGEIRQWREWIDAYRPGGRDGDDPEFAGLRKQLEHDVELREVAQRSQDIDKTVAKALLDVNVPAGLADRLLASIAVGNSADVMGAPPEAAKGTAERVGQPEVAGTVRGECVAGDEVAVRRTMVSVRRRVMWKLSVLVATAAAIAAMFLVRGGERKEILTAWDLADSAPAWAVDLPGNWRVISELEVSELPPVAVQQLQRWQAVTDPDSVVYQLATGPGDYLFVLPGDAAEVHATRPPVNPNFATSRSGGAVGHCVAVWKNRGCVYVLVIRGAEQRYRELVQTRQAPMAMVPRRSIPIA